MRAAPDTSSVAARKLIGAIVARPVVLIERLNHLDSRGRLPQSKAERELAIRQVRHDLAHAPLARRGRLSICSALSRPSSASSFSGVDAITSTGFTLAQRYCIWIKTHAVPSASGPLYSSHGL